LRRCSICGHHELRMRTLCYRENENKHVDITL